MKEGEKGAILPFPALKNKGVKSLTVSSLNLKALFSISLCVLPKHSFRGVLQQPVHDTAPFKDRRVRFFY